MRTPHTTFAKLPELSQRIPHPQQPPFPHQFALLDRRLHTQLPKYHSFVVPKPCRTCQATRLCHFVQVCLASTLPGYHDEFPGRRFRSAGISSSGA